MRPGSLLVLVRHKIVFADDFTIMGSLVPGDHVIALERATSRDGGFTHEIAALTRFGVGFIIDGVLTFHMVSE